VRTEGDHDPRIVEVVLQATETCYREFTKYPDLLDDTIKAGQAVGLRFERVTKDHVLAAIPRWLSEDSLAHELLGRLRQLEILD
jgi:hypothetical protein